ncbi:MAG: hypothetical protein QM762_13640 [Chryseolinea sp.]
MKTAHTQTLCTIAFGQMNLRILILLGLVTVSCEPKTPDLREHLDGWEYVTTFKVLPNKTISVVDKESKIMTGDNHVLIFDLERKPIFKPGQELTDLHSTRSLLIQLSPTDSLVRPDNLGSSKMYRQIIAFSPDYGTNELKSDEKIELKNVGQKKWSIKSDLTDFQFSGEFSFLDSAVVTSVHKEMYN